MASASSSRSSSGGKARGTIELWGRPMTAEARSKPFPARRLRSCPKDRRGQGLLLSKSRRENLTLFGHPAFLTLGASSTPAERSARC